MNNMFGANITIWDSVVITLIALGVVFSILSILAFLLSLFKYIPQDSKKLNVPKKAVSSNGSAQQVVKEKINFDPNSITDERMIAAMLVASIEAAGEVDGAYVRVKSIKEIN